MRYLLITILLTLGITFPLLGAVEGQFYSATLSDSYYLSIPHFQDEIPARSSNALAIDLGLFGFSGSRWDATFGVTTLFVTDSITFGNYRARGFNSVGINLSGTYFLTDSFGILLGGGTEFNTYHDIEEVFASFSIKTSPVFRILDKPTYKLDILAPLTIHLRKEITGLLFGIGLRYSFLPFTKGGWQ